MKYITRLLPILLVSSLLGSCGGNQGDSIIDVFTPEWSEYSEENVAAVRQILDKAATMETNVISNTISNGLFSDGESSYAQYSFYKGLREDGSLACYHKSNSQTAYYFYEGSLLSGYIEKDSSGDTTYTVPTNINQNKFDGYDLNTLMIKSPSSTYGGYASLLKMFENGSTNSNKDTQFRLRRDGFDMKYAIYSKVTYTYWDALINASFSQDGTLILLRYKYVESYAKDIVKNEDGTFSLKSDFDYRYKETIYRAETGELGSFSLPVEPDSFNYSSFDIYYKENKIGDGEVIAAEITDGVILDVKNILPESATDSFDPWIISVTKEGEAPYIEGNFLDTIESKVNLTCIRTAGDYEVNIKTKHINKTFTIHVDELIPQSISFIGLKEDTRGLSVVDVKSSIATGDKTNICAYINPIGAVQDLIMNVELPDGVSDSDYSMVEKTYRGPDVILKYYEFSASVPGDYIFTATSEKYPAVSSSHSLKVFSPLTMDEVFAGKYCLYDTYRGQLAYTFEFTPNTSTTAIDGECKITNMFSNRYGIYTYSGSAKTKKIVLTYKTDVVDTVEDLFKVSLTTDGTRSSVILSCSDSPVEWESTYSLLDWDEYISLYLS